MWKNNFKKGVDKSPGLCYNTIRKGKENPKHQKGNKMKTNTFISGYYPAMNDRFVVVLGGNEKMVKEFNKGNFGAYAKTVKGVKSGSFKLEKGTIEMY